MALVKPNNKDIVSKEKMEKDLVGWGTALIVLGLIHFGWDYIWAIILISIGIITLKFKKRFLYIVIGILILLAGLSHLLFGDEFWQFFGIIQLVWGFSTIYAFKKYEYVDINDDQINAAELYLRQNINQFSLPDLASALSSSGYSKESIDCAVRNIQASPNEKAPTN